MNTGMCNHNQSILRKFILKYSIDSIDMLYCVYVVIISDFVFLNKKNGVFSSKDATAQVDKIELIYYITQ